MNYIEVANASLSFGEKVLFSDVNLLINQGDKIALIAKNGSGKTTFLKLIAGEIKPEGEQADVIIRNGINIAYLKQEPPFEPDLSVIDSVMNADIPAIKAIRDYEIAVFKKDQKAINQCISVIEDLKAWDIEAKVKEILYRLNIDMLDQKMGLLSGGQRRRVALAKILIQEPEVLILDEPTNHLDLEMIEWLEEYLSNPNLTLFMVTHDRYFLERVCDRMVELDEGKFYAYSGNYSDYLTKREERKNNEGVRHDKLKKLFKKELEWVNRQPKARGTKAKSRVDQFQQIKQDKNSFSQEKVMEIDIDSQRLGGKIVEFHNVSKSFGDLIIMKNFDYKFKKAERVGIAGKNGSGKSTFINMMTGQMPPDTGKIIVGETVQFGYYHQQGLNLKEDQRVIDVVREIADYIPLKKGLKMTAETLLERFLFPRPQQQVFVSQLSGGEKRRLYLLTVLIQNPNFLILDEPTNDLDIITLNILEDYLMDFPGCLIVISHDRYFMDKLTDHLFIMHGEGNIKDFNGSYSEWRAIQQAKLHDGTSNQSSDETSEKKLKKHPEQVIKNRIKKIEQEIERLETQKEKLTNELNANLEDLELMQDLSKKIGNIVSKIEEFEMEWMEKVEELNE